MGNSYTNEKFRPDDDVVITQDDLYSEACVTESNLTSLDLLKLYSDPVTLEHTGNRDAVNQNNANSYLAGKYNNASYSIAESPRSNTHSSQDYVKTSRIDTRITKDAITGNVGTSNVHHDRNIRYDADSSTSTEVNNPTEQKDGTNQDGTFPRGGKYNLQPHLNPNFLDLYSY